MSVTKFVMLGSGTPNCMAGRTHQSSAVIAGGQAYMIDCGAGALHRAIQVHANGEPAMNVDEIKHLFLTHLHPDHTTGLAAMMISPWVKNREGSLHVYGPAGTRAMVDHLIEAYKIGIANHRGVTPLGDHPLAIVHEYDEGQIFADGNVTVDAFRVTHGGLDAFGLRFVTADKTIVHSGDTCLVPHMQEWAKDCDILVHEVYSAAALSQHTPGWQQYHSTAHTSSYEVAAIANYAKPGLVVLNHYMTWGRVPDEQIIEEIKEHYDGPVVLGRDLSVYE